MHNAAIFLLFIYFSLEDGNEMFVLQVKNLATGRDRPPVLAYKLALELAKKMKKK